jgi:hypothetical protein
MAITPTTLQTLITILRQRTNMENNQFVTDAELTGYLNNSLCLLDGILISKYNDYKLSATLTSVVAGKDYLALPSDFLKFRGLDVYYNAGSPDGYLTLNQFSFRQRNKRPFPITGPLIYGPYQMEYRLQGNQIKLIPGQAANQWQYRLWYTPDYIPLVALTDTLESYMDSQAWYEYAIVESAIKVLAKQDLDPHIFMAQAAELKEHIQKLSAPSRNAGDPASIVDTSGYGENSGGWGWNW